MLAGCAPAVTPAPPPTPVTVQLSWTHQAQFAGYYAAAQNGDFAAEGLAVDFVEGGPGVVPVEQVLAGAAQFGVAPADVLLVARAAGKPVRAIAAVFRRSPRVYVALAESGITRPQDFVGKTISVGRSGRPHLETLMKRAGIRPEQYTVVDSTPDLAAFTSGEVQVRSVFLISEVLTLEAAGYKLNIIYPDDYGIHFYGEMLFATDDFITQNPGVVLAFVRATLKGWTYAVEHPAEAGAMVLKYKPDANPDLEIKKMIASLPLINTGEDFIGWMRPAIWADMETTLRAQGVLNTPLDVTQVYTMQFLESLYK